MIPNLDQIRLVLQHHRPCLEPPGERRQAAVALVLRQREDIPEVFFIQRARHRHDPWSGDLGFPGGRVELEETPRQAAVRETAEEVGFDLEAAEFFGRLDDLRGAHLPIVISCFIYHLPSAPRPRLNREVAHAFWTPLPLLLDPCRRLTTKVRFGGEPLHRPAMDLLGPGRRVLWGITYRLILRFLEVIDETPQHRSADKGA